MFRYNCTTSELLVGVTDHEFFCFPVYNTNQKFIAPKTQDSGTILCKKKYDNLVDNYGIGITWAVPCNQIAECHDGSDELGCEFPDWLVPSILSAAGAVLNITLFVHLYKCRTSQRALPAISSVPSEGSPSTPTPPPPQRRPRRRPVTAASLSVPSLTA